MGLRTGMPGEIKRRSVVSAPVADDHGSFLRGRLDEVYTADYIIETAREEDDWKLTVQWLGRGNQGFKVVLPTEVLKAIYRQRQSITDAQRKLGAQKAVQTILKRQAAGVLR